MTLKRPTIILFDMDGTTVRHINPRLLHLLEVLDDASYRLGRLLRGRRPDAPPACEGAADGGPQRRPRLLVHRAIHRFRRKPVEQIVEPCPGVISLLQRIKSYGLPTALVSNGLGQGYGHDILATFGLEPYFDAHVFREQIRNSKPHPEPLLTALRALGRPLTPDDVVWYIGDRHKDITAALAARAHLPCPVEPLAYGVNASLAAIERGLGTHHIVTSYYDLEEQLAALMEKKPEAHHDCQAACLGGAPAMPRPDPRPSCL